MIPILESAYFTGSTNPIGDNFTQTSSDASHIALDPAEPSITNFYIGDSLGINGEFQAITAYNGTTKVATVSTPFLTTPPAGTSYLIRKVNSFFNTAVSIINVDSNTNTVNTLNFLDRNPSTVQGFYTGDYMIFTNGPGFGDVALITSYFINLTNIAWSQPDVTGNETVVSTTQPMGFRISANLSGPILSVTITLMAFESVSPNRTLTLSILNGAGLSGTILYQNNYSISNVATPTATLFTITTPGPFINAGAYYTITLLDVTPNGINTGYVDIFGVAPNNTNYVTYNSTVYPQLSISDLTVTGTGWSQPSDPGSDAYLSTTFQNTFNFTPSSTAIVTFLDITLTSFETVSSGRTIVYTITQNGTTVFTGNALIANTPTPTVTQVPLSPTIVFTDTLAPVGSFSGGPGTDQQLYANSTLNLPSGYPAGFPASFILPLGLFLWNNS